MSFRLPFAFTSLREESILLPHLREQYAAALLPLHQRSSATWIFATNDIFLPYLKDAQVTDCYRKHSLKTGILTEISSPQYTLKNEEYFFSSLKAATVFP